MGNKLTIFLCVFLHAILVLIYAAILVTYQIGVYDRPLSLSQGTVRTVITVVSQSFTIAYCAVMVLLTQRITLNGFMKRPQTLTAIHDKSSAWLGLGASLQTLGRQRKLITDLLGISMITLYLLLIFVVHTTLPGIFGVTTQNVTTFATYPTTLARQLITINNYTLFDDEDDWSILSVYNTLNLTTAGVWNNILYDIIPPVENATGAAVEVNATIFSVDCAPLPDVVQTGFDSDNNFGRPGPAYNYEFGSGKYSGVFSPAALVLQVGSVQSADSESADESSPSMIVVISPLYPVVDSIGTQAPTMNMQNPSLVLPEDDPPMNVTFIGCNFSVQNSSISVDSRSRTPIELSAPPTSVNWPDWTDPGVSSDPLLGDDTLQSFPFAPVEPMVGGLDIRLIFNATFNQTLEGTSSILESFLDNDIGATSTNLTVGDINWSLGRAYAATIWYQNTILVPTDSGFNETSLLRGEASIPSSVLQERLTVNTISLIAGLVASCVLFLLTIVMVAKSGIFEGDAVHHDVSGLLPILWLLGNEPRLAELEEPDLDALRAAGMEVMTRIENLRQRGSAMKGRAAVGGTGEEYELEDPLLKSPRSSNLLSNRIESVTSSSTAVQFA